MPDFSGIREGIFIGNAYSVVGNYATKGSDLLDVLKIDIVISALTEDEYENYMITREDFPGITWYRLVIDDDEDERISEQFEVVYRIIKGALSENKKVMVHCAAGMSRSPTLVIAYLMLENKWCYEEAYDYVRKRRPIAEPNIGFIRQLKELEYKLKRLQDK